jgi:lipid-binding SYLF domain-containing protein
MSTDNLNPGFARGHGAFEHVITEDLQMKRIAAVLTTAVVLAGSTHASFAEGDKAKLNARLQSAKNVVNEIMATPDKGIPQAILAGASCVVVVPSYKKAAFLVGAQYGQGVATCRTPKGWSAPVFVQLAGGSFGFQIGGQSTDLVLVAMNQQGLQDMLKNKFKIGGDAAASAGPVGRNAQAGTDWKLNAEFLTYSRSKGLFAGIDLDGTVLSQNEEDTRTMYGANVPYVTVLQGSTATPAAALPFVRTVAKFFVISKSDQ